IRGGPRCARPPPPALAQAPVHWRHSPPRRAGPLIRPCAALVFFRIPTIAVSRTGWRLRNRAGHGFVPLARLRQFLPGDSMRSRIDPLLGMSVAGVLGLTAEPQWVYVAETGAVVRFPYRSGDLASRGERKRVVPRFPPGGHATSDVAFSPDGATMYVSVGSAPTMPKVWAGCPAQACKTSSPTIRSGRHGAMRPIAPM